MKFSSADDPAFQTVAHHINFVSPCTADKYSVKGKSIISTKRASNDTIIVTEDNEAESSRFAGNTCRSLSICSPLASLHERRVQI